MGILQNTISLCQFRVAGKLPAGDLYEWARRCLAKNSFRPIDQTADEVSSGWVHLDDPTETSFAFPRSFWRDHYLAFTLRRDQRRVPSALFRTQLKNALNLFLAENPGLRRVPRQKKQELSDAVKATLFSKVLPAPTTYDAVWDTRTGILTFAHLNAKAIELFEDYFKNTFEGMRLLMIHPFSRAEMVLGDSLKPTLLRANLAPTGDTLDLVHENRWIGCDFFLWLTYRTVTQSVEYAVNQPGPAGEGETFTASLNDRVVLEGDGETGVQKVSVIGSQDHFREVCTALENGKRITEATLYLEKEEHLWKMTVKGLLFHFASLKCPSIQIEKDDLTDEADEREAAFYERMYVLEEGLQLFDSLYAAFLKLRLSQDWVGEEKRIRERLTKPEYPFSKGAHS